MLTIFYVQNVLIILDWCLCDFLVLKHIHELCTLHLPWSFTDVGTYFYVENVPSILDKFCFWLDLCVWSIVFSVRNVLVLGAFGCFSFVINLCELLLPFSCELFQYIAFDYLLMLTIYNLQNILIILDWCLCDFLLLKHTNELHALHLHWTFTDVDIFLCWHIFVCKMFQNFNITFDYLLMLTIYNVQNVLIILDWGLCDFLVLKHIHELHTLHLHWSFTNVDKLLLKVFF